MLKKITTVSFAIAFMFALAAPFTFNPMTFELSAKSALADHHKGDKMKDKKDKKEKGEKKEKKDKNCSRDQNCNDDNENRKDEGKSQKGGKSEEMKGKGKKK